MIYKIVMKGMLDIRRYVETSVFFEYTFKHDIHRLIITHRPTNSRIYDKLRAIREENHRKGFVHKPVDVYMMVDKNPNDENFALHLCDSVVAVDVEPMLVI